MRQSIQPRRRWLAVVVASAVLLTGCFGGTRRQTGGAVVNPDQPVKLTIWRLFDDQSVWQPIIDQYRRQNPGVEIEYVTKDYADYLEDSLDALAAGTGPDIWLVKSDWMAQHADKLVPAPEAVFAQPKEGLTSLQAYHQLFPDVVYDQGVVGSEIFGLPLSVDTLVLYYNQAIFAERRSELNIAGDRSDDLRSPPVTWSDVLRYSDLVEQREGGRLTRAGIALGATNVEVREDILAALMLQRGTQMVSADRKSATFNLAQPTAAGGATVPGREALEFWRSFADSAHSNFGWSADFPSSVEAFKQGKLAMMIHYSYLATTLAKEAPTLEFELGPLPQIDGAVQPIDYAGYWFETVTKSAENPELAWDFLSFAFRNSATYAQGSGRPTAERPSEGEIPPVVIERHRRGEPWQFQKASAKSWYKGRRPLKVDGVLRDLIQSTQDRGATQAVLDVAANRITELFQQQVPPATPANPDVAAAAGQ